MSQLKSAFRVCGLLAVCSALDAQGLPDNLTITSTTPPPYQANIGISTSGAVTVNSTTTTTYTAGSQITLLPGFTAIAQSATPTFIASIGPPPFYPNSGSGGSKTFSVTASDPGGYQNITNIQVIYNWQPSGIDGCLLNYDVASDSLHIGDLTGSLTTFGSMQLKTPSGTLGDLVNSNCQIIGQGSSITTSGNNMTLVLNTQFRPPQGSGDPTTNPPGVPGFIGQQNIYMQTTASSSGSFQLVGTWTPYAVPEPGTYPAIIAPNTVSSDGTIAVEFHDLNGFNYQPYAEVVFGVSQTDPNACRIRYDRGTGAANHILSVYGTDFTQPALIGIAPVGTPGAIVQDAGCILDIGSSYLGTESGTGAVVYLALKFKTTGTINTYAQAFDRQNAGSAPAQSTISIPALDFSLSPVSAVTVQQGGSPVGFTLAVPATGGFSGSVGFTYTAPQGVTLTFQPSSLNASPSSSTTVQVSAASSAVLGSGTIVITGTSGTLSHILSVPVTVVGTAPAPTFVISSSQDLNISPSSPQATFSVSFTGLNGFPANQQISLLVDPNATNMNVSVSLSSITAYAPGSVQVTVRAISLTQSTFLCAVIDATSSGATGIAQTILCIDAGGYSSNFTFAVPQTPPAITVPTGGRTTIYGSVSSSQYTTSVNFIQSVTCPGNVIPCDASATFGALSNGVVPITLNPGSVPAGTTYTQSLSANGQTQTAAITVRVPRFGLDLLTTTPTGATPDPPPTPAPTPTPPPAASGSLQYCNDPSGTWNDGDFTLDLNFDGNLVSGTDTASDPVCGTTIWQVSGSSSGTGVYIITASQPSRPIDGCGIPSNPSQTGTFTVLGCTNATLSTPNPGSGPTVSAFIPSATEASPAVSSWTRSTSPPGMSMTVDLYNNAVSVTLTGANKIGNLAVDLNGTENTLGIVQASSLPPGTYSYPLGRTALSPDQYGSATASWGNLQVIVPVAFNVLGPTRFSQYNTPSDNTCVAPQTPVFVFTNKVSPNDPPCTYHSSAMLRQDFVTQVDLNGSGNSAAFGRIKAVGATDVIRTCSLPPGGTTGAAGNTFVQVPSITGSCNSVVNPGTTVATFPNPSPANATCVSASGKIRIMPVEKVATRNGG